MTKYQICDFDHDEGARTETCVLCRKPVDLSKAHYVQLDASRRAMHTECAIAEAIVNEANA